MLGAPSFFGNGGEQRAEPVEAAESGGHPVWTHTRTQTACLADTPYSPTT